MHIAAPVVLDLCTVKKKKIRLRQIWMLLLYFSVHSGASSIALVIVISVNLALV